MLEFMLLARLLEFKLLPSEPATGMAAAEATTPGAGGITCYGIPRILIAMLFGGSPFICG